MRHTRKKIIHLVATARLHCIKIAPLYHALKAEEWAEPVIVHTGRRQDDITFDAFFRALDLPGPHHYLGAGKPVNAEQTGTVLIALSKTIPPAAMRSRFGVGTKLLP